MKGLKTQEKFISLRKSRNYRSAIISTQTNKNYGMNKNLDIEFINEIIRIKCRSISIRNSS